MSYFLEGGEISGDYLMMRRFHPQRINKGDINGGRSLTAERDLGGNC